MIGIASRDRSYGGAFGGDGPVITVPATITDSDWVTVPGSTPGSIVVNLMVEPNNHGSPITAMTAYIDGIAHPIIPTTGPQTITGMNDTDTQVNVRLTTTNGVGESAKSPTKSVTPKPWTPADLLIAGTNIGGFYDATDISTLFQDNLFTNPVTAFGQTVGGIRDKGPLQLDLDQQMSSRRPIYDNTLGIPQVLFDRVDDLLYSPEYNNVTGEITIIAGHRTVSYTSGQVLAEFAPNSSSLNNSWGNLIATSLTVGMRSRGSAAVTVNTASADPNVFVLTTGKGRLGASNMLTSMRTNRRDVTADTTTAPGGSTYGTNFLRVGGRNSTRESNPTTLWGGGLTIMFFINRILTNDEELRVQQYIAKKTGVIL